MSEIGTTSTISQAAIGKGARLLNHPFLSELWAGWSASVLAVPLAVIAMEAAPHLRGIGFFTQLRYAVIAPLCVLCAVSAAFLYRYIIGWSGWPRMTLATVLAALAVAVLMGMAASDHPGLVAAALPAVLSVAIALALLVPRFVNRPWRSWTGTAAIVVLGLIEAAGVAKALSYERVPPPGSRGLAFDIPRSKFDVDHKFIDLRSGAHIHYVDEGKGATILFLHGNPSWSFQWRGLIQGLRGSYRCIALDYPGFGLSTAPAGFGYTPAEESRVVEEFIDQLGLRDVTLVMQDWGGPIGIGLAERHPELVRRVILGSTWAWPTSTSEPRGKWSKIAGGPIGEFLQVNFNGVASFGLKSSIVRKLPDDVTEVYLRPFLPVNRRGIAVFYPAEITAETKYFADIQAGLPRLADKKALIFWAAKDPGISRSDLTRWEQTFPNHKTIEFSNASHFFFEDEVDQMNPAIRAFMSSDQTGMGTAPR